MLKQQEYMEHEMSTSDSGEMTRMKSRKPRERRKHGRKNMSHKEESSSSSDETSAVRTRKQLIDDLERASVEDVRVALSQLTESDISIAAVCYISFNLSSSAGLCNESLQVPPGEPIPLLPCK